MRRTSYREQDYIFGQRMLNLRMSIGLTQAALAEILGVSRNAVGGWEAGQSYPKAQHLKHFIVLGLQQQTFTIGHEKEEIHALWEAAHQKVLLDKRWLQEVLRQQTSPLVPIPVEQFPSPEQMSTSPVLKGPRVDWGDAFDVPTFYGREEELILLSRWIVQERCRVVSVLGMGGIGKSALATTVMHQVAHQFEVIIWRSLRNRPSCEVLINDCLQVLAPQATPETFSSERRLQLLMEQLRTQRVLLVLDNLEVLLEEGSGTGRMRSDFDEYTRLLQQTGETAHQSCLVLTSREMPTILVPLEGHRSPIRTLRLIGLEAEAGIELLEEKEVVSPLHERAQLVEVYQGNPLALKIVAQTIVELFGGEITPFLQQGEVVFGGVRQLLDEQFERLSALEQTVLLWLAVLREPVGLSNLVAVLSPPKPTAHVLEAVEGLRRRSLIEQGQRAGSFTLHSVVLEYATTRLIEEAYHDIEQGRFVRLVEHGLSLAQAKEYVRQTQGNLLVAPLLTLLQSTVQGYTHAETHLLHTLDQMREWDQMAQGYGPANVVSLLHALRGHLRNLDLSHLALRDVFLQGVEMQDTTLTDAVLQQSVFTEPLDAIMAVTVSRTGAYWVAATRRGEIRVWDEGGWILRQSWHSHMELIWKLAFSPDERTLASASANGSIKLSDVNSGTLLWESWLAKSTTGLAFSPDGRVLASGGFDMLVRLWDPQDGTLLEEVLHVSAVCSLAWSSDGRWLASGCSDGSIWLWQPQGSQLGTAVEVLSAHTHWVIGLAFSPDGTQLASVSSDGTVKLWDMITGACLQTFFGHVDQVQSVAWSPDGGTLTSCGYDATIRFWDLQTGRESRVLQGHTATVTGLAFTPDSHTLLSSSCDGTLREWDVESGQCLHIIGGYTAFLLDLDWSPDGKQLASCGTDTLVTLWDTANATLQSVLQGYRSMIHGVAWSPDGRLLASVGRDGIGLWDPTTGARLHDLRDPDAADTVFHGVAWSPDGNLLAAGSYLRGVLVWDVTTRRRRWVGEVRATRILCVAWSPDGHLLASGDYQSTVSIWDVKDGTLHQQLGGHDGIVVSVAWSPDGRRIASAGGGKEDGQLFVWEMPSGKRMQTLTGHSQMVSAVAWTPSGEQLISGGSDGRLRWWQVESGQCLREQEAHHGVIYAIKVSPDGRVFASCGDDGAIGIWDIDSGELLRTLRRDRPYERLNITGICGLSEAQKASLRALGAFEETSDGE